MATGMPPQLAVQTALSEMQSGVGGGGPSLGASPGGGLGAQTLPYSGPAFGQPGGRADAPVQPGLRPAGRPAGPFPTPTPGASPQGRLRRLPDQGGGGGNWWDKFAPYMQEGLGGVAGGLGQLAMGGLSNAVGRGFEGLGQNPLGVFGQGYQSGPANQGGPQGSSFLDQLNADASARSGLGQQNVGSTTTYPELQPGETYQQYLARIAGQEPGPAGSTTHPDLGPGETYQDYLARIGQGQGQGQAGAGQEGTHLGMGGLPEIPPEYLQTFGQGQGQAGAGGEGGTGGYTGYGEDKPLLKDDWLAANPGRTLADYYRMANSYFAGGDEWRTMFPKSSGEGPVTPPADEGFSFGDVNAAFPYGSDDYWRYQDQIGAYQNTFDTGIVGDPNYEGRNPMWQRYVESRADPLIDQFKFAQNFGPHVGGGFDGAAAGSPHFQSFLGENPGIGRGDWWGQRLGAISDLYSNQPQQNVDGAPVPARTTPVGRSSSRR